MNILILGKNIINMIKTVKDYEDELCKKFPQIPRKDISKMINYGWK
jgi:uncharacterized protein (DUF433 family)